MEELALQTIAKFYHAQYCYALYHPTGEIDIYDDRKRRLFHRSQDGRSFWLDERSDVLRPREVEPWQ
jgi:hypothetical protein